MRYVHLGKGECAMNAIVFYVAGVVSLIFLISAALIVLDVTELPKQEAISSMIIAGFFACLAWWAAAGEVAE